jgi:outer membrane lipoprotein SlyB
LRRLALPFVLLPALLPLALAGCNQGYSPNTYASNAAQVEATVQRGVIIGVRQVMISANGTLSTAAGAAAGGVAGSQVSGGAVATALGTIGGTLAGSIGGAAAAQAVGDTKGWEYIVQEDGDKLVSVTQTSKTALPIGQHVLVISDSQQARIVPDYTVQIAAAPAAKPAGTSPASNAASSNTEIHLSPLLPDADAAAPLQVTPLAVASDPSTTPSAPSPAATAQAAAPQAATSTSGAAATPKTANNGNSATSSASATATSVQSAAGTPASTATQ